MIHIDMKDHTSIVCNCCMMVTVFIAHLWWPLNVVFALPVSIINGCGFKGYKDMPLIVFLSHGCRCLSKYGWMGPVYRTNQYYWLLAPWYRCYILPVFGNISGYVCNIYMMMIVASGHQQLNSMHQYFFLSLRFEQITKTKTKGNKIIWPWTCHSWNHVWRPFPCSNCIIEYLLNF